MWRVSRNSLVNRIGTMATKYNSHATCSCTTLRDIIEFVNSMMRIYYYPSLTSICVSRAVTHAAAAALFLSLWYKKWLKAAICTKLRAICDH